VCGKCPKAHKNLYAGAVDVDSAIYSIDFDLIGALGLSQVLSQTVQPTPPTTDEKRPSAGAARSPDAPRIQRPQRPPAWTKRAFCGPSKAARRHEDALGQWWVEPAELHRVAEAPARAHGRLVRDKIYPGMWRVVGTSGTLTDIVNETAKDVA
jgi:hypothetical protein